MTSGGQPKSFFQDVFQVIIYHTKVFFIFVIFTILTSDVYKDFYMIEGYKIIIYLFSYFIRYACGYLKLPEAAYLNYRKHHGEQSGGLVLLE